MGNTHRASVKAPHRGRTFVGIVVSLKTAKTAIVEVIHMHRHPLYRKAIRKNRRFPSHYEGITLALGDKVKIIETKPVSRTKHFLVMEKIIVNPKV